jgi:hypothetical protein
MRERFGYKEVCIDLGLQPSCVRKILGSVARAWLSEPHRLVAQMLLCLLSHLDHVWHVPEPL